MAESSGCPVSSTAWVAKWRMRSSPRLPASTASLLASKPRASSVATVPESDPGNGLGLLPRERQALEPTVGEPADGAKARVAGAEDRIGQHAESLPRSGGQAGSPTQGAESRGRGKVNNLVTKQQWIIPAAFRARIGQRGEGDVAQGAIGDNHQAPRAEPCGDRQKNLSAQLTERGTPGAVALASLAPGQEGRRAAGAGFDLGSRWQEEGFQAPRGLATRGRCAPRPGEPRSGRSRCRGADGSRWPREAGDASRPQTPGCCGGSRRRSGGRASTISRISRSSASAVRPSASSRAGRWVLKLLAQPRFLGEQLGVAFAAGRGGPSGYRLEQGPRSGALAGREGFFGKSLAGAMAVKLHQEIDGEAEALLDGCEVGGA